MTPAEMAAIHTAAFADARPWDAAAIAEMLARGPIHAVSVGETGFALIQVIPPEAELLTLAVHPDAQRQGVGRAVLTEACARAADLGAEALHLEVDAANTPARALYDAFGFVETGRRPGYYAHPGGRRTDALLLSRALPAQAPGTGAED